MRAPIMRRRGAENAKPLPLFEWREQLRLRQGARRRRIRRWSLAALASLGAAAFTVTIVSPPSPRLVWNASASAPVGLYHVRPGSRAKIGDMVVARTPAPWRLLAAQRHYLPANVPLVKRLVAAEGDIVCAHGGKVSINGVPAVTRRARDGRGRILPWWEGCRALRRGDHFLLMADARDSFDGRYFGTTRAGDVIGPARLIWAR